MKIFIQNHKEVINLQGILELKNLSFKDPQYGQNPITILCNYSLYILFHLPFLNVLDTMPVHQKGFQEIAEVF